MLGRFRLGHPPLGDRPVCMPVHPWSPKIRTEMNLFNVIRKPEYWSALDNPFVFRKLGGFTLKALDGLKHIQDAWRSEEHTSELQSLMRISYAVFCLKKKTTNTTTHHRQLE